MSKKYLTPDDSPPSQSDYQALMAQFIALILATGKTSITIPHSIRHPLTNAHGILVVEKETDDGKHTTTYTVVEFRE